MNLKKLENFDDFIGMIKEMHDGKIKFSDLNEVLSQLAIGNIEVDSDELKKDYIVQIDRSDYVAFISHNIYPDDLDFIAKIAKFNVVFIEMSQLEKLFKYRQEIFICIEKFK